jgi:hypothetical protein
VIAATKLMIFDTPLSVIDKGFDGYEKSKKAHVAKIKNIPAGENKMYFDSFVKAVV